MKISCCRTASAKDAEAITKLVNNAYRPETGAHGWTHESELVSGDRINASQVTEIIVREKSVVLLGLLNNEIVACVQIEPHGGETHIGMLAVDPKLQGAGIGKEILDYAESYANTNFRPEKFVMVVVSARSELNSFYIRRGYQRTGVVMDYPRFGGVGVPKRSELKIEVLEKPNPRFEPTSDPTDAGSSATRANR